MNIEHTISGDMEAILRRVSKVIGSYQRWENEVTILVEWTVDDGYTLIVRERRAAPEGHEPPYTEREFRQAINGQMERYCSDNVSKAEDSMYTYRPNAFPLKRCISWFRESGPFAPQAPFFRQVREGDALVVRFRLSNDNGNLKSAGVTHDQCDLALVRGKRTVAVVRVADEITPVVSTVGMIDTTYRPKAVTS